MTACPHCGEAITETQSDCPNCGAKLEVSWPPCPTGAEEESARNAGLPSDTSVGDGFASGCLLSVPLTLICFLIAFFLSTLEQGAMRLYHLLMAALAVTVGGWLAVTWIIYLRQRPQRPRFARGFGYSLVALLISLVSISLFCGGL